MMTKEKIKKQMDEIRALQRTLEKTGMTSDAALWKEKLDSWESLYNTAPREVKPFIPRHKPKVRVKSNMLEIMENAS